MKSSIDKKIKEFLGEKRWLIEQNENIKNNINNKCRKYYFWHSDSYRKYLIRRYVSQFFKDQEVAAQVIRL